MSIERRYTKTFEVYRNEWVEESGYSYSGEVYQGEITGHLQQATPEQIANLGLNLSTTFSLWTSPASDIQIGDRLILNDIEYLVRAIQDNSLVGNNTHLEIIIEKSDENHS
jgi:hypothetical protein